MNDVPDHLKAAHNEMLALSDMYHRLNKQCFDKCVDRFHDDELSLGENTCIDRCCAKYMEVHKKIGEFLAAQATANQ